MTTANKFYNVLDSYGIEQAIIQGKDWYPEAWRTCREFSMVYGITPERVAAIMAVTSPRARWQKNVDATYMIIEDSFKPKHKRRASYGILNANAHKGYFIFANRYAFNPSIFEDRAFFIFPNDAEIAHSVCRVACPIVFRAISKYFLIIIPFPLILTQTFNKFFTLIIEPSTG